MSELSASDSNREETPDSAASDDMRDGEPRRTDPRTFLVQAVEIIPRMVVPLVAVAFATRDEGSFALPVMLGFGALFLAASTFFAFLGWWRQTYRVGDSDIRLETGVLSRAARSVPYERIQDVSLEQGFVPRLFGLERMHRALAGWQANPVALAAGETDLSQWLAATGDQK